MITFKEMVLNALVEGGPLASEEVALLIGSTTARVATEMSILKHLGKIKGVKKNGQRAGRISGSPPDILGSITLTRRGYARCDYEKGSDYSSFAGYH